MAHVLLLEPNKVLADQYRNFLARKGYEVAVWPDAQAAIIAADAKQPDIIIVELLLAGHSGIEFLYELRSYGEWQRIPVLVLSRIARADSGLTSRMATELGIVDYLYKPETSLEKLAHTLEKTLSP